MRQILICSLLGLSACATPIHYTGKEKCAFEEMKLVGTSLMDGNAGSVSHGYNQPTRFSNTRITGVDVQCAVPSTDEEKLEIGRIRSALGPKVEYNSNLPIMKLATGAGYLFYVVPGVLAKVYFDGLQDEAVRESEAILRAPASIALP